MAEHHYPNDAVFYREGDLFVPTDLSRSAWGPSVLHGGPPAGLLARAIELECGDPELHLSRLTIDLFRAVPKQPLKVETQVIREGHRIRVVQASIFADGTEVSRATGLWLRQSEVAMPDKLLPQGVIEGPHEIETTGLAAVLSHRNDLPAEHRLPRPAGFHLMVEARRVAGVPGSGQAIAWIRIPVPLVAGEPLTPLVRVASTSDFGNALGQIRPTDETGFINADITLYLHRLPEGEWIGLDTVGAAHPTGLGMVETVLHDERGTIGRVVQAVMVNRRH